MLRDRCSNRYCRHAKLSHDSDGCKFCNCPGFDSDDKQYHYNPSFKDRAYMRGENPYGIVHNKREVEEHDKCRKSSEYYHSRDRKRIPSK